MPERSSSKFRPDIEPLEAKRPLSAGVSTTPAADSSAKTVHAETAKPATGYLVYRITNPNIYNKDSLKPPFQQVLVQSTQPVPGQVYNILQISVRNGSAQTFSASSGLTVRLTGQANTTPILTGSQTWVPGQVIVFYVLTKKYYPLQSQVSGGFQFNLEGAYSITVPGPSGIFLRIKYNPATFAKSLDDIVAYGQGAQGGLGATFGLPDTSINEILPAATRRPDFGGYF